MTKNIFIKSMARQPIRTLLLALLIATASFAFVVRVTEYIIVRDQIANVSRFFQTVGFLSHRDGNTGDVSEAIEYIASSPHVAFYDRRRGLEGNLVGMTNAYIEGSRYWRASWAYRYHRHELFAREYVNLMPRLRPMPGFAGFVSGDSFFYGELLDVVFISAPFWGPWEFGFYPQKILYVQVDQVMQGYPERLFEGQILRLRMDFPEPADSPLENMEIGQRYFFKGTFYWFLERMQLDSRTITKYIRPIGDQGLWYVPVAPGETVDTVALGMCQQLQYAHHAQSAVYLRTTRSTAHLPYCIEGLGPMSVTSGRHLDMDDYINARPVVLITRHFAERRQVGIGDTITITVNPQQYFVHYPYYLISNDSDSNPLPVPITTFPELGVLSKPEDSLAITLELEVVGIFEFYRFRPVNTGWSSLNKFMFIPDSLIPGDWELQSSPLWEIGPGYTPSIWFSFVLHDQRNQPAFLWETRDALMPMGVRATFVGRDGSGFWSTADTILISSQLNLIIFSGVLILVLAFTMAIFMWQRHRDYAILRALGCKAKNIYTQSAVALTLFGLPAACAGGIAGWFFAIRLTAGTVEGFREIMRGELSRFLIHSIRDAMLDYYMDTVLPPIILLIVICILIFATMLAIITVINLRTTYQSVLSILKGAK